MIGAIMLDFFEETTIVILFYLIGTIVDMKFFLKWFIEYNSLLDS